MKKEKKKITAGDVSLFASVIVTIIGIIFIVLNFITNRDIYTNAVRLFLIGLCCLCANIIVRKIEKSRK